MTISRLSSRLTLPVATAAIAIATVGALVCPSLSADARPEPRTVAAAPASVTVADMAFSSAAVTVGLGESVTWTFKDPVAHTSTSDQGFWDSGTRSGGVTYVRVFTSAGTFAYHCTIHAMMRGKVSVPITASGSPSAGWLLRWSTKKGKGGVTFDVQTRLGSGTWKPLVSHATSASQKFDPAKAGSWSVRARSVKGSSRSGWSPTTTIPIS